MEVRRDRYLDRLVERKRNGLVKVVTGVRGCGKSYLLFKLFRDHLLSEGVPEANIIESSLDDASNRHLRDAMALYDHVASRVGSADGQCYIFLDEVRSVPDIADLINGLRHLDDADVYVTCSGSGALSSDVPTELRGRLDEVRVRPLSFGEYRSAFPEKSVNDLWKEYMGSGGMPGLLGISDEGRKMSYLDGLIGGILKDAGEHDDVRMLEGLSAVFDVLCSSVGSLINPKSIWDTMAASELSYNTVRRYIDILCDMFLFEKAGRYVVRRRRPLSTSYKCYAADAGIISLRPGSERQDPGRIMENIIFNELRARGYRVAAGVVGTRTMVDGKQEYRQLGIDFVVDMADSRWYIQSAYGVSDP